MLKSGQIKNECEKNKSVIFKRRPPPISLDFIERRRPMWKHGPVTTIRVSVILKPIHTVLITEIVNDRNHDKPCERNFNRQKSSNSLKRKTVEEKIPSKCISRDLKTSDVDNTSEIHTVI